MKTTKQFTVTLFGRLCTVEFEEYQNGRIAIELIEKDTGEPYTTATINMPNVPLAKDEVIIKNYSENEGVLDALVKAGVVSKPIRTVPAGFATADVCKLLYTPNEPKDSGNMITRSNYFTQVREQNLLSRFPESREFHEFVAEATDYGRDWSAYTDEPETREVIDSYFAKLNEKLKATSGSVTARKRNRSEKDEDAEEEHHRPRNAGPSKRNAEKAAPQRKQKHKPAAPKKKSAKKPHKVLNLPKGKLVELVDPHLLFVGRFLRMNNQTRTRNALEKFFSQINQAADARVLRKASPYAQYIIYIQKQLFKYLAAGHEEVAVEIPAVKFAELLRAVAKEQQMSSVRLLKRYHNMAGRPASIEKASKLYNEMYNAIEKGKIPEKDRLFKRVVKVMRDLSDYVKAEDTNRELERLPAELGGVLGFMDGCLCDKDREMNRTEAPQDVSCSFR